ncbi:acyl-CoA dehydrogenase family protein [Nonomuraea fuscirosea]|uniref:acyl-CoA dehydrogenase family protein n=1 Tax=Nonomuraea fuscirosea TaxID=1291556 RepID=UPI003408F486
MRHTYIPDTTLTEGQRAFRADVRAFLRSDKVRRSVETIRRCPPDREAGPLEVYQWLGERGWLAPNWPERYGGAGRGVAEAAIVTEEMCLAGVPDDAHVLSVDIVGMFLLHVGTEDQRRRILPSIASGERIATVLFTEPGCGSDLSRLTTRAEPDGDGWRLHGTKIYNQKTQFSDVGLCAARTSEGPVPYHGITLFLVPLDSPGVTVRTVENMTNDRFHEVAFDGIRLTESDVVGSVDDGWRLLNEMLVLERTGIDFHAKIRRWLDSVVTEDLLSDPVLAARHAELDAHLRAAHALAWRVITEIGNGRQDPATAAMAKWYVTEQARDVIRFCLDATGLPGLLSSWDPDAPDLGLVEAACRYAPTYRLGSGTSEVMLYIIATSALELL